MTDPIIFLQLAKIASARGKLNRTLKRVYLMNYVRAVKRQRAAAVTATQEKHLVKFAI
ncbi:MULTISPECIES: hypothetical protein [unclassified Paenibacillus]|uniref:hypothetical protein n=1 Tax=unclassified Paenibacillus TaxID=185978 RepID=UPI000895EC73|nr:MULTISPECIES: hypothetical protein [unclassified Paenibacillus]MCM3130980.1 hypothetical protein [Paenibacillus sp. MER 78]SDX04652.1 hypothetical protein SAMN05518848_104181 [Paenibacillus sp. PDC88]